MSTNSASSVNYVPAIDYTSKDYAAILQDMVTLIPTFSPQWTNRNPSDFGMTLLELFAYMGDILNYYIDRSANEALITTATQRQSVLDIASILGYSPTPATASTVTLTFQNSSSSPIAVPAGSQVATSLVANATTSQIIFETNSSITVPAASGSTNGTQSVLATQGTTVYNEVLGVSNGTPNQTYQLANANVIFGSTKVVINGVTYQYVEYLVDSSGYAPVYTTATDENNITYIVFGDGVSGRIPPTGVSIYATYRIGGGSVGNVATGLIQYIIEIYGSSTIPVGLTVSNQDISVTGDGAATGGSDAESTDSIRTNAPLSIRAINRAVSINDYAYLAVQVKGVAAAIANADVFTSVTLYLLPSGDAGVLSDNFTLSTVFNNLTTSVQNYLTNKSPANTTITFQPPHWVGVNIILAITVDPQYNQTNVTTNVKAAINNLFYVDNVYFNQTVTPADLYKAVNDVDGVAYQNLLKFVRADQDQTYSVVAKSQSSGNVATLYTGLTATVTAASASGGTITYTANNSFVSGQTVTITGLSTSAFNLTNATIASASSTQFTVTSAATGTGVTGASATALVGSANTFTVGQTVSVSSVDTTFNGTFVVTAATTYSFSYALVAATVAQTSISSGAVTALTVGNIVCAINELPMISYSTAFTLGSLTINPTGGVTS